MPPPQPKPRIAFLPRPGPSVINALVPRVDPAPPIPPLFTSAVTVRAEAFVVEQRCSAADEVDADDAISFHWILFAPSSDPGQPDVPAATMRLVPAKPYAHHGHIDATDPPSEPAYATSTVWDGREPYVKIGRVATAKRFRGRGYAALLMEESLEWGRKNKGEVVLGEGGGEWRGLVLVRAQRRLERWYCERLGFVRDEGMGVWWEEGIEHVAVWKRVDVVG